MTTVKSPFWRVWRRRDTLERRLQHNLSHENCLLFANVLICRRHHNRWLVQPTVIEYIKFIETIECLFTKVVNFTNSDYFDQTPELYYFDFNCKYSCKGFMYKEYFSFYFETFKQCAIYLNCTSSKALFTNEHWTGQLKGFLVKCIVFRLVRHFSWISGQDFIQ